SQRRNPQPPLKFSNLKIPSKSQRTTSHHRSSSSSSKHHHSSTRKGGNGYPNPKQSLHRLLHLVVVKGVTPINEPTPIDADHRLPLVVYRRMKKRLC
ncbi:hypothetical protein IFM89_011585, partial [Coptis chinensis]